MGQWGLGGRRGPRSTNSKIELQSDEVVYAMLGANTQCLERDTHANFQLLKTTLHEYENTRGTVGIGGARARGAVGTRGRQEHEPQI